MIRRLERILKIMVLLRTPGKWTVKRLSEKFGVTRKTIYKDMKSLEYADIPLTQDNQGYGIVEDFFLKPPALEPGEALALIAACNRIGRGDALMRSHAKSACNKILAGLKDEVRKKTETGLKGFGFDCHENFEKRKEESVCTEISHEAVNTCKANQILKAIENERTVIIEYSGIRSTEVTVREVESYTLVHRGHAWYLLGYCRLRNEMRMFKLSRIKSIIISDNGFERDAGFDLKEYFRHSFRISAPSGAPVTVKVRLRGKTAAMFAGGYRQEGESLVKEGKCIIYERRMAPPFDEFGDWICRFGAEAEVLEPEELRNYVARKLKAAAEVYANKP